MAQPPRQIAHNELQHQCACLERDHGVVNRQLLDVGQGGRDREVHHHQQQHLDRERPEREPGRERAHEEGQGQAPVPGVRLDVGLRAAGDTEDQVVLHVLHAWHVQEVQHRERQQDLEQRRLREPVGARLYDAEDHVGDRYGDDVLERGEDRVDLVLHGVEEGQGDQAHAQQGQAEAPVVRQEPEDVAVHVDEGLYERGDLRVLLEARRNHRHERQEARVDHEAVHVKYAAVVDLAAEHGPDLLEGQQHGQAPRQGAEHVLVAHHVRHGDHEKRKHAGLERAHGALEAGAEEAHQCNGSGNLDLLHDADAYVHGWVAPKFSYIRSSTGWTPVEQTMSDLNNSIYERLLEAMRNENWTVVGTGAEIRHDPRCMYPVHVKYSHVKYDAMEFVFGFTTCQSTNGANTMHSLCVCQFHPEPKLVAHVTYTNTDPIEGSFDFIRSMAAAMRN